LLEYQNQGNFDKNAIEISRPKKLHSEIKKNLREEIQRTRKITGC
jgi:hypothetical protein